MWPCIVINSLIIKPNRCTNFSNLFLEWNSTCIGQLLCPSSGVFHCTHNNGICHTGLLTACEQDQDGTIAVFTVKNSWWWTEELSETCRVSFQEQMWEISASSWFYYKKYSNNIQPLCNKLCMREWHSSGK